MIELTWSWFAFFMGVLATVSIGFWALIFFAIKQWKKSKSKARLTPLNPGDDFSKMMGDWDYKNNRPKSL
jgi:hypothetical protein